MSDLDEQGATRDARTIAYLKEGIKNRDAVIKNRDTEIEKLKWRIATLETMHLVKVHEEIEACKVKTL